MYKELTAEGDCSIINAWPYPSAASFDSSNTPACPIAESLRLVTVSSTVMDIGYLPTRSMSQHMPVLGLLGLNGDSLVSSVTFSTFLTDTRID